MWLLDVNVNRKIIPLLTANGVESQSAIDLGWRLLTNGRLIEKAFVSGFKVMLTNDVRIEQSAEKSLVKFSDFALVLLRLPQIPSEQYLQIFQQQWAKHGILPEKGRLVVWPQ